MCSRVFILVLCCVAGLAQNVSAAKSEAASSYAPIGNILDPATYFFGFFYQIFPANIDVIFPFTILPRLNPSIEFFRLNRCPRPTVPSCLPVGTPALAVLALRPTGVTQIDVAANGNVALQMHRHASRRLFKDFGGSTVSACQMIYALTYRVAVSRAFNRISTSQSEPMNSGDGIAVDWHGHAVLKEAPYLQCCSAGLQRCQV